MRLAHICFLLLMFTGIVSAQETNFPSGPQYLLPASSTMLLRSIATPTLSLDAPLPPVSSLPEIGSTVSDQSYVSSLNAQAGPDLFPIYYGYGRNLTVELIASEIVGETPPSISGVGFTVITDPQSLRELGYGITVGEAASFWKAHKPNATHVYTNADIQRLHPSGT